MNDTSKYVFIAIIELCALNGTKDIQVPVLGLLLRSCLRENDEPTVLESLQSLQSEGMLLEWKCANSFFSIVLAEDQKAPSATQDELEVVGSRAIRRALLYKLFSEYKRQNSTYVHFPLASLMDSLQSTKEEIFEHVMYLQNEYYLKYEVMDGGMCTSDITHDGIKLCEIKTELFKVLGTIQVSDNKKEEADEVSSDPKKVFVVHGRNDKARKAMFSYLRSIGLQPIEWLEAISYTGNSAPYIGEILDHAFKVAQAVVVLVTGDDFAMIHPELAHKNDPDYETKPTPQARPNVLFEAGLALGRHPKRTVIAELGQNRPFSDIAGLHVVRLSNDVKKRHELAIKLKNAGCLIDIENKNDWMHEGDFDNAQLTTKYQGMLLAEVSSLHNYSWEQYSVIRELIFNSDNLGIDIKATQIMKVKSNVDDLKYLKHSIGFGENAAIRFTNFDLSLQRPACHRTDMGEIELQRTQNSNVSQKWRILFTPGLRKHNEASYAINWSYQSAKFMSYEEFAKSKSNSELPLDKEFDSLSRSTSVPCNKLISTVKFPEKYPIHEPSFTVTRGGYPVHHEIDRIIESGFFKVEQDAMNRSWRLTLEVEMPLLSVSYILQWKPPYLNELLTAGLITDEQKQIAVSRLNSSH